MIADAAALLAGVALLVTLALVGIATERYLR